MNTESFFGNMCMEEVNNKFEITIYPKYNRCYVKEQFRKALHHPVELLVDPDNPYQVIIKKSEYRNKGFSSQKVLQQISSNIGSMDNMCFHFFEDKESDRWIGIYLPDLSHSFLWDIIKDEKINLLLTEDIINVMFYKLYAYFAGKIAFEEIKQALRVACYMTYALMEKSIYESREYVMFYAFSLMRALKKCNNKGKCSISYDKPVRVGCTKSFFDYIGEDDVNFKNIEIEDFLNSLNFMERYLLNILLKGCDIEKMMGISNSTKRMLKEINYSLKCKAIRFNTLSYIKSVFAFSNEEKEKFLNTYKNIR